MTSVLPRVLGLSILLATVAGCDDGGTDDATGGTGGGPIAVGGSNTGGSGTTGGSSTGGTGAGLPEGVPLIPTDGWVDGMSNELGIQGAMFSYSDMTSAEGLVPDFTGTNACIKGTAALVDMACTPVAPAVDCYGTFWGAAIGLNLNQPIDPVSGMGVDPPLSYDATALTGFAFEIQGAMVPTSIRFKVEDASGEFCTGATKPITVGPNTVLFSELKKECWLATAATTAEGAKPALVKIAWQVVTNAASTVPFDYCVSNVRALR